MIDNTFSGLLSYRQFVRFWLARLGATAANQMLMVAVAWQMYDLTDSAWDLGLVGLYQFVPALLMTLPAGQVVDRLHRGRVFAASLFLQALIAAVLIVATLTGFISRELILGLSVLFGVSRAFQMPAQQALIPQLVALEILPRAVAAASSGIQIAVIGGPALGGLLYVAGPAVVYACGAALFVASFALTLGIRYQRQGSSAPPGWRGMFSGVVFVWRHKVLLGATSIDLFAVLLGGATALLPIFARDILQTGPVGLGILRSAPAIGALLMSLVLTRWPLERQVGKILLVGVAVFGLAMLIFGLSSNFLLSFVALSVSGAADNVSVVVRQTLAQLETPDDMRGRVGAVNSIFIGASNQLGEFESGATAEWFGPVGSVVFGGTGTILVAALWLRLFPSLAKRDRLA
ncbi:MFS transporter [Propionivibrio limicola]|uniref:MFS transporter n=1 Tax=Propionivibrio limicola TaxID=167645 RepID=UPI0012928463|nr:MFS transporter [Propionivibrio limicola]